jgi:hypothetical protein
MLRRLQTFYNVAGRIIDDRQRISMLIGGSYLKTFNGDVMQRTSHTGSRFRAEQKTMDFNVSKFQAIACMTVSVGVSIGMIFWSVKAFV